jgi:hypothetical protein
MRPRCPVCETVNDDTTGYCMGCGTALPDDDGFDAGSLVERAGRRTGVALVAIAVTLFRGFLSRSAE